MSSLIMHDAPAISFDNVSKVYKLHGSQRDQLIDVLGLKRLGFRTRTPSKEFVALNSVSLDVPRGHRVGIVGRNGAGKTTLLKLICGNFSPTTGTVQVNGRVQALMNVGLGFHPDYTGRQNVEASLQYNGLEKSEYTAAMEGIEDFCELGDFIDQPFKTYSLGMQARLMFAAATAIRPDILIVDEVLGAGDAYFVAKSKARVEGLIKSGCTMLLVSHSMQQVLELCDEVIWLDKGRVRMRGDAFEVVKAYEHYLHGAIDHLDVTCDFNAEQEGALSQLKSTESALVVSPREIPASQDLSMQDPRFIPHSNQVSSSAIKIKRVFDFVASGGISRWESEVGVKLCGFTILTENGCSNEMLAMRPARLIMHLMGEIEGQYNCRYGVLFNDMHGNCAARIYSPIDSFYIKENEVREVSMTLNPVQLGQGDYSIGVSVLDGGPLEVINSSRRFDLLGRSFTVRVKLPDSLSALDAGFIHTAEWGFENV